jgi:hypothetical protein
MKIKLELYQTVTTGLGRPCTPAEKAAATIQINAMLDYSYSGRYLGRGTYGLDLDIRDIPYTQQQASNFTRDAARLTGLTIRYTLTVPAQVFGGLQNPALNEFLASHETGPITY